MANRHQGFNDHDHRKTAIVRLAARIGIALCRAEYRHLSESEWARLDRMHCGRRLDYEALQTPQTALSTGLHPRRVGPVGCRNRSRAAGSGSRSMGCAPFDCIDSG